MSRLVPLDAGGVYQITAALPRQELYELTSQLRSSASIPANLAEGCGRNGGALKLIKPKDHAELSQRDRPEKHADRAASKAKG